VLLEIELALEGVVDGFDDLPQGFEEPGAGAAFFSLAGRFWPRSARSDRQAVQGADQVQPQSPKIV
jgi:hypothetical protein